MQVGIFDTCLVIKQTLLNSKSGIYKLLNTRKIVYEIVFHPLLATIRVKMIATTHTEATAEMIHIYEYIYTIYKPMENTFS